MVKSLLFGFAFLLLIGCKSNPSIVGKWSSDSDSLGINSKNVSDIHADGTFTTVTKSELSKGGTALTATDTGTWKLNGDKLSLLFKDIDWKFSGSKPELVKRATEGFQAKRDSLIADTNRMGPGTIVWNNNDEFEYTASTGDKYTYRRQR